MTLTVHSEPVEGPAALSVLEGVAVGVGVGVGESVEGDCVAVTVGVAVAVVLVVGVGERVLVSLVDVVVVVEGDRGVVVSVGVELAVAVGLGVGVAPSVMIEDEVAVVPSVPTDPQPASTTVRTRASTESERRIGSTLIQPAIKFPTFGRFQQLSGTGTHSGALSRTANESNRGITAVGCAAHRYDLAPPRWGCPRLAGR